MINWSAIQQLAQNNAQLHTKRGEPFRVVTASDITTWIGPYFLSFVRSISPRKNSVKIAPVNAD